MDRVPNGALRWEEAKEVFSVSRPIVYRMLNIRQAAYGAVFALSRC